MKRRNLFLLSLCSTALLASCVHVQVPNVRKCSVRGLIRLGANCAETNTGKTSELTYEELVDYIQALPERPDPANPGQMLPKKGAAIITSSLDAGAEKTAMEEACRALGSKCSYELQQSIKTLNALLVNQEASE